MSALKKQKEERDPAVCSICYDRYDGWSHNAEPVNNGRCCSICNDTIVIPARIRQLSGGKL
jgi:hypothetical protein